MALIRHLWTSLEHLPGALEEEQEKGRRRRGGEMGEEGRGGGEGRRRRGGEGEKGLGLIAHGAAWGCGGGECGGGGGGEVMRVGAVPF